MNSHWTVNYGSAEGVTLSYTLSRRSTQVPSTLGMGEFPGLCRWGPLPVINWTDGPPVKSARDIEAFGTRLEGSTKLSRKICCKKDRLDAGSVSCFVRMEASQ